MKLTTATKIAAALLLGSALTSNMAQAIPAVGNITFSGTATTNTGTLNYGSAGGPTSYSTITGVTVSADSGVFAVIPVGTTATFSAFSFSASGITPLWTLSAGGETFTFNATSVTAAYIGSPFNSLVVGGDGTVSGSGNTVYASTPGVWSVNSTGGDPTMFSFGAGSSTLPDGGTTALLLALGLSAVGMGVVAQSRKRLKA